jgi:hypothetical protein
VEIIDCFFTILLLILAKIIDRQCYFTYMSLIDKDRIRELCLHIAFELRVEIIDCFFTILLLILAKIIDRQCYFACSNACVKSKIRELQLLTTAKCVNLAIYILLLSIIGKLVMKDSIRLLLMHGYKLHISELYKCYVV